MEVKSDHCCDVMDGYATDKNSLVNYESSSRAYSFYLTDDPHGTHQRMNYCFWCGAKLPEDLGNEWARILKEDYKLDNPYKEWDKVPAEFKTDEWWKNRCW